MKAIKRYGEPGSLHGSDLPVDTTFKDARTRGEERRAQAEVESMVAGYAVPYDILPDGTTLYLRRSVRSAVNRLAGVFRK